MKRTDKNGKEEKSLHVRVKQVSVQNRNKVSIDIRLLLSFWGNVTRKWPNIKFTNHGIMVPTKTIKADFPTGNHTWNVPKPSQKNVFFSISIYVLWLKDIYKSFADLGMAQNILHALFLVIDQNFMPQECIPVGCVLPAHWPYLRISLYPMHAPPEQPHMPLSNHACPPSNHTPPEQPHMPPRSNHACPHPRSNHACPPEQPCTPPRSNHTCPPPEQPHTPPGSNHACPPGSNHACPPGEQPCPPRSNHARPPCGQNVDTRFWKYYLAGGKNQDRIQ